MSVHVISWVLQNSEERLGNRLVLIVLADHAAKDGTNAFPSVNTIAVEARLSVRAVRYALRELEQHGAIRAAGKHKSGTIVYDVLGVQILQGAALSDRNVADFASEPSRTVSKNFSGQKVQCPQCGLKPPGTTTVTEHLENVHGVRAA